MEYFRSWWKDCEEELAGKVGEESMPLERAMRTALARADAWVLTEPQLKRLHSLCSSEWCRNEVTGWISTAKPPVTIQVIPQGDGFVYEVGQYGPDTGEWLRQKLLQYPEATEFRIARWATEAAIPGLSEARERAEALMRNSGRKLVP